MTMLNSKPAVILLAEDDPADQELTKRALDNGAINHKLKIVENGEEALDYLLRKGKYKDPKSSPTPDLFLLDLNMPKLTGRDVLKKLKSQPEFNQIATVVLTTSKQKSDVLQSYELGVKSFITKPSCVKEFFDTISTLSEYWLKRVTLPHHLESK